MNSLCTLVDDKSHPSVRVDHSHNVVSSLPHDLTWPRALHVAIQ